jgi:uncharacterized protein
MDRFTMYQGRIRRYLLLVVLMTISPLRVGTTDKPKSLVLKDHTPERSPFRIQQDNSEEELWDAFLVVKKANSGDPVAQHELGLRYLMGKDFSADTEKAAYWICKAAEQSMITAQYNYGLLLNNSWGVAWNPFEAYQHFKDAALHGLVEAEYVYGLLLTENLAVQRNYVEAYHWIKMAADSGFAPAAEVLQEFTKRGIMAQINSKLKESHGGNQFSQSKAPAHPKPALLPVFLDLTTDSIPKPDDETLMKEAIVEGGNQSTKIIDSVDATNIDSIFNVNTLRSLHYAAEAGSPEALTMIGRLFEQGINAKKDLIKAAVYYIRAIRFDSPWSPMLLWSMIHREDYFRLLKQGVDAGDPASEFVWAMLIEFGFDNRLTEAQVIALLEDAARQNFPEAIVQLGVNSYSGHWVKKDKEKAIVLLKRAEQLGSQEATVQLYMIKLRDEERGEKVSEVVKMLKKFSDVGSILAESVLGYCYQEGKGVQANKSEAIKLYRHAAGRGSQVAYDALRKLYDELRPSDSEFQLAD